MQRFHVCLAIGSAVALVLVPARASGQGFSVNEHSACAQARAGTGTAMPCADGSAMVFNPAGLTQLGAGRGVATIGGTFIAPSGGFTDDLTGLKSDLKDRVFPVPHVYVARGFDERFAAGIGVFAPYGLTTDWPATSQGRFSSYRSVIRNIYVQPTAAFRVNQYLSVGAGFDINFAHLRLRQRVDLSTQTAAPGVTFGNLGVQTGTDFADVNVSGNGTGYGYHVGITITPTDRVVLGARYLSRQNFDVNDGTVEVTQINTGILVPPGNPLGIPAGTPLDAVLAPQFQPGGPLVDQTGSTGIRLPEQISAGIAFKATDRARLMFDYQWQNWKVWDTIILDFSILPTAVLPQKFKATHGWRFGGEYDVSPAATIRLGYLTHSAASPDQTVTPTLPEAARSEVTAGIGARLGSRFHVDVAYQYLDQADRRGRTGAPGTPNNGLYEFKAHLFGGTLSFTF